MHRKILWTAAAATVLSVIVFAVSGCKKNEPQPKWTIIAYLDGNNNLDYSNNGASYVIEDAQSLEKVGSTDEVNIIAAVGALKTGGVVRYYHIEHYDNELPDSLSSTVLRTLGTTDMSDYRTLQDFIKYAVANYPADHYMLLLDDHGGGWRGCCLDEQNGGGRMMSLNSLKEALQGANVHFDLIVFHACLMGQAEVAYQLKDFTDYVVASEFSMPMQSVLNAPEWLGALTSNPDMTAGDLASRIVQAVYNAGRSLGKVVHMAAVKTSEMDRLAAKIGNLGSRISDNAGNHWNEVVDAWGHTHYTQYDDPTFVDLREFAVNLKQEPNIGNNPSIAAAADSIIEAMNDAVTITMTNAPGLTRGGLTIYLPSNRQDFDSTNYARIDFTSTHWINFISQFIQHAGGGGGGGGGGGDQVTITGTIHAYGNETQYVAHAIFSHDNTPDNNDIDITGPQVNAGNINVTFDVPDGYGDGDFVLFYFVGTTCMDIDNDGNTDDIWIGFYPEPDNQGHLRMTPLQANYNAGTIEAYYYIQDACGGRKFDILGLKPLRKK